MEPNPYNPQEEQHLFDQFDTPLTPVNSGKRFGNYIIDLIGFYVFMYLMSYVIIEISYDLAVLLYGEGEGFDLGGRLLYLLLYGMYMGLMEAIFKGRSLGKFITGTIAVYENGQRISGQTALLRGLCRAVPFNALSALGSPCRPWHDKWTRSVVVSYKDLPQPS